MTTPVETTVSFQVQGLPAWNLDQWMRISDHYALHEACARFSEWQAITAQNPAYGWSKLRIVKITTTIEVV